MFCKNNKRGFTLVEVIVGMAIFVLFAIGIYGGIQFVFKVVYQSRLRILETAILNEQIEIVRNMSFFDVGIVEGSPAGVLERTITTTQNNINFLVTRTIRNIDDEFDGVIGGTPNDTAPADYKLVNIDVICLSPCLQRNSLSATTYIAPKLLEGDPTHGALFIEVFDANADPVQGASVHIVSTSTDPTLDMVDTTDNEGMLRLVDLGAGMDAYSITVSKSGYITDQTRLSSVTNSNPTKSPASVEAQGVSEISFSIDNVSDIELTTVNSYCSAVPNAAVNMAGTYLIGTEPDVLLVDTNITTGGSGDYTFSGLHWDSYGFKVTGYDLLGSIPGLPVGLLPGVSQTVQLVLGSDTANSIVVHVLDNITEGSLSNATVRLSGDSFDQTKVTGVGFIRQTDWSGGSGQLEIGNEDRYWSDDGKVEVNDPAGDMKLAQVGQSYVGNGELESSVFDLIAEVNFVNIGWEPMAQPVETGANSVRWQIATSNTSTPETWEYLGPDGTAITYYDEENLEIGEANDNNRYLRYKLFLSTASSTYTPTVSDLTFGYTTACSPPGQVYFGGLTAETEYTVDVVRDSYQNYSGSVVANSDFVYTLEMVSN